MNTAKGSTSKRRRDFGHGRKLGCGMRERAALLGGTLNVESAHGAGTTVFVRIPVAACGDEGGGARG